MHRKINSGTAPLSCTSMNLIISEFHTIIKFLNEREFFRKLNDIFFFFFFVHFDLT